MNLHIANATIHLHHRFPESYQIERGGDGRVLTKTAQVRMCGNSVCPPMAKAYVAANYAEAARERMVA